MTFGGKRSLSSRNPDDLLAFCRAIIEALG
jgi:hypothetical protein